MPCNKPQTERNDRIFRDVQAGMSHQDACDKYDLSRGRLNAIICSHPEHRGRRAGLKQRNSEIAKLRAQGVPEHQVAKQFGVGRNIVAAAYSRWRAKNDPVEVKVKVKAPSFKTPIIPTREQIEADRKLIAEYMATNGVKVCPTVALVPTQATLKHNPGIDDRWNGSTGWPASDQARRAQRGVRTRQSRALACV